MPLTFQSDDVVAAARFTYVGGPRDGRVRRLEEFRPADAPPNVIPEQLKVTCDNPRCRCYGAHVYDFYLDQINAAAREISGYLVLEGLEPPNDSCISVAEIVREMERDK